MMLRTMHPTAAGMDRAVIKKHQNPARDIINNLLIADFNRSMIEHFF
jgi:hypothetical protein